MGNAFTNTVDAPVATLPVYSSPLHSYAVPDITEDAPYADEQGWAADAPGPARDTSRMGFSTDPARPISLFRSRGGELLTRHNVEDQDADGWEIHKGEKRFADNPNRVPSPETRPTQRMSPRTYTFLRPFGQDVARYLNGMHFSMASHRREYPILGQQPPRTLRNTYRITPAPWDADMVDMPPDVEPTVIPGRIQAVDIPPSSNRAWRLG
jgi:hypothetical protein